MRCTLLPHSHRVVRQFLDDQLPGRWVERAEPVPWPPRSLNLNTLRFLLMGYVKEHVYIPPLTRAVNELKECIPETVASTNGAILRRTWQKFEYRLDVGSVTRGAYTENLQYLMFTLHHLY
jgi:hypothetical protein